MACSDKVVVVVATWVVVVVECHSCNTPVELEDILLAAEVVVHLKRLGLTAMNCTQYQMSYSSGARGGAVMKFYFEAKVAEPAEIAVVQLALNCSHDD